MHKDVLILFILLCDFHCRTTSGRKDAAARASMIAHADRGTFIAKQSDRLHFALEIWRTGLRSVDTSVRDTDREIL